jgi:Flp pilus assembly protein TadB
MINTTAATTAAAMTQVGTTPSVGFFVVFAVVVVVAVVFVVVVLVVLVTVVVIVVFVVTITTGCGSGCIAR